MTVSKALRDAPDVSAETKAEIKLLARQMGYVPDSSAQCLRTRTTRLLGLAVSSTADPFLSRVVLAIEQCASEMGYDVLLAHTLNIPEREDACIRRFLSRRVDGLLLAPVYRMSSDAPIYRELQELGVPTVLLGQRAAFCSNFPNVQVDDILASYSLTRHLHQLGHRRIACLTGPLAAPWAQERFEGYRRAIRESGQEVDEKLVFQAGRTVEDGVKATTQMLQEGCNATAVQACNDLVAVGCAQVLLQQGLKIPEDVSLAGFGNISYSDRLQVPLTTVNQPKYRLGSAAAALLQQLLKGRNPEIKPLPAELVVRASTGIAPAVSRLGTLNQA